MKNQYKVTGNDIIIYLQKGMHTIISLRDLEKADSYEGKWFAKAGRCGRKWYVEGNIRHDDGSRGFIQLHRWLTDCPRGKEVDHRDSDGLNNTHNNLRVVTRKQNGQNVRANHNSKTGVRGVTKIKNSYVARVGVNGKRIHVGAYPTLEEAEQAVIKARKKYLPYSEI